MINTEAKGQAEAVEGLREKVAEAIKRTSFTAGSRELADAAIAAIGLPPSSLAYAASHAEEIRMLAEGKAKVMGREPTKEQQEAAFGPIMMGGRNGPITADLIRQEAAISTYQKMWDMAK